MDREKFIGVVMSFALEGEEPVEYVLNSFSGEGNTAIVFGIAPLNDAHAEKWVIKFFKPDVRFEMTVLHHSFRIAEKLYPNHPLLMTPDERMRRLTDEMLGRIESEGSLFRLSAFRDMIMSTIEVLARQFEERFQAGTLSADWTSEIHIGVRPMIDNNLVLEIESLLDNEAFVDELQPFFEHILEDLRVVVAAAKKTDRFRPLSQNRLFKLLGLHLEDFINWDELITITDSHQFRPALTPGELAGFAPVVSILHYRASSKRTTLEAASEDDRSGAYEAYKDMHSAAIEAARYMDAVAAKYHANRPQFSAYARNWHARTLLLEGEREEALTLFEAVLKLPVTDESQVERHDALIDLADLLSESEPQRAEQYALEAAKIRQALGKV